MHVCADVLECIDVVGGYVVVVVMYVADIDITVEHVGVSVGGCMHVCCYVAWLPMLLFCVANRVLPASNCGANISDGVGCVVSVAVITICGGCVDIVDIVVVGVVICVHTVMMYCWCCCCPMHCCVHRLWVYYDDVADILPMLLLYLLLLLLMLVVSFILLFILAL